VKICGLTKPNGFFLCPIFEPDQPAGETDEIKNPAAGGRGVYMQQKSDFHKSDLPF
jgi:hypothetical protein